MGIGDELHPTELECCQVVAVFGFGNRSTLASQPAAAIATRR